MPILECQCGMVMSVQFVDSLMRCIRCGHSDFPYEWHSPGEGRNVIRMQRGVGNGEQEVVRQEGRTNEQLEERKNRDYGDAAPSPSPAQDLACSAAERRAAVWGGLVVARIGVGELRNCSAS